MEYLIYTSTALVDPGSAACRDIVLTSERRNAISGLTGFLHAEKGHFIQYLEGRSAQLWQLYDRLHHDRRHRELKLLGHGLIRIPRFAKWQMGYSTIDVISLAEFIREVSFHHQIERITQTEALAFLMAASARIDLGISHPPRSYWV